MGELTEAVLDRVKVREVAGVFRSRDALDDAVDALLLAGYDRGGIDVMASAEVVRETLGPAFVAAEEIADVRQAPRRPFIAPEDFVLVAAIASGIVIFAVAVIVALAVLFWGGEVAEAIVAALVIAGVAGGIATLWIARRLKRSKVEEELRARLATGGLVLWVRARSPEREEKAQEILRSHGAKAIRVHEIEIEKRLEDLPLSSLRPDPWLGDERLGQL
jgi:hypothetical protein